MHTFPVGVTSGSVWEDGMSRWVEQAAFILALLMAACTPVSAETRCETLNAPPTGTAPAGAVLRAGHLGRQISALEPIIHFYHDLIGLELNGRREQPRAFFVDRGLQEVASLDQGVSNPYDQVSRAGLLPIPGTSAEAGGAEMTIEAIEIRGIASKPFHPQLTDPGASYLKLIVSNLDETLAALKGERFEVISAGGNPVVLSAWPGMAGNIRAVFVRDPDGYPVELMQAAPATTAAVGSRVLGARVAVVVDSIESTCQMYQSLAGPEFKFWVSPELMGDEAYTNLTGAHSRFRLAEAMVPGSPVVMELIEYQDHRKHFQRPHFQDPGAAHFLFIAKDDDEIISRMRTAGLHTSSPSNAPVFIDPTIRMFFVRDPQGFWIEFMDFGVKKDPSPNGPRLKLD